MSHCHGFNDKFAVGARDVMRRYLRRMDNLPRAYGAKSRLYSEQFLRSAIRRRAEDEPLVQVHHQADWMFCKMGRMELNATRQKNVRLWRSTSNGAWPTCSMRIVAKMRCEWMVCDWCGLGCACYNDTCTQGMGDPRDLSDPLRHLGQKLCHKRVENKTVGKVATLGRQLF